MLTAEEIKKTFRLCITGDGFNCAKCPANGHGLPCSEVAMAAGLKYIELLEAKLEAAEKEAEIWQETAEKLERRLEDADQRAKAGSKRGMGRTGRGWIEGIGQTEGGRG